MEFRGSKYKELSEQLGAWWGTQKDYATKRALAGLLKVHPDTLGDYFSGRKFPQPDIAVRLYELTHLDCLRPVPAESPSKTVPTAPVPPPPPAAVVAASGEPLGSKYKELSEQLAAWWGTQKDYATKRALAGLLKVHPDTLGDYFSGRKFPQPDIAVRLYELTHLDCLRPVPAESPSKTVSTAPVPPPPPAAIVAASGKPLGSKYKELSEQLAAWWRTQKGYATKRALAGSLKVHPDTLGDYFSGRKFPRPDIAVRLYELSHLECLRPEPAASRSNTVSTGPEPAAAVVTREEPLPAEAAESALPPGETHRKRQRYQERAAIISLQRTTCPFCAHDITKYANCGYCQQHFVWANIPIEPNT